MRALALFLALLLFADATDGKTESGTGIVYGRDHAFLLSAPDGWVLDNTSGKPQGLPVVFYRFAMSWKSADAVMYATTSIKDAETRTVDDLIAYDVARFREKSARLKVTALPDIGNARVRRFEGDQYGNHEAVAYIDAKNVVVMLVLSARTEPSFHAALPAFEQLVRSYRFVTSDVRIDR